MTQSNDLVHSQVDRFSNLPPEIYTIIAEQILSPQTFFSLIQVCRAFEPIFVPFLHEQHSLRLSKRIPSEWKSRPLPNGLSHIKHFKVTLHDFEDEEKIAYHRGMNAGYSKYVAKLLARMPHLRSFSWKDEHASDENETPSLILRNGPILAELKRHSKLSHLFIQFGSRVLFDINTMPTWNCWPNLTGFRNLTSLELYHLIGDTEAIVAGLTRVLGDNQALRILGLGRDCDVECEAMPEVLLMPPEISLLEQICKKYGSLNNATPLPLSKLRLGYGFFIWSSESDDNDSYLETLFTGNTLKTLELFNGLAQFEDEDDHRVVEVKWYLLRSCSSIRQLSVTRFTRDVRDWLNANGQSVVELIVTNHYSVYERDLDRFRTLELPHLTALTVRERTPTTDSERAYYEEDESEYYDSDEHTSESEAYNDAGIRVDDGDNTYLTDTPEPETSGEALSIGPDSNSSPESSSESSVELSWDHDSRSDIPRSPTQRRALNHINGFPNILHRLSDGGSSLKRLSLCLNLETQWEYFSAQLRKMTKLTHLRLDPMSFHGGEYLMPESTPWPGVTRKRDMAMRYAQLAKLQCPSLQYIKMKDWAWHCTLPHGSAIINTYSDVLLERLSYEETMVIELFALETFTGQAGLLGPDDRYEEISDEKQDMYDAHIKEIMAAFKEGRLPDMPRNRRPELETEENLPITPAPASEG